jgi:hypothetical protein
MIKTVTGFTDMVVEAVMVYEDVVVLHRESVSLSGQSAGEPARV